MRILFFDIFTVLALLFLVGLPLYALWRFFLSRNWEQTTGVLLSVDPLEIDYEKKYFLYEKKCSVRYSYLVNGIRYENRQVTFIDIFGFFFISGRFYKELHKSLASALSKDKALNVYFNRDDPTQAVISRDLPWVSVAGYLFSALLVTVGWIIAQDMLAYLGEN